MHTKGAAALSIVAGLLFAQATASAHHATATQFDTSKTITFKGVISKLDWANPHVQVYLDVKGSHQHEEHWEVELPGPGGVIIAGLRKDLLKVGTTLTVLGCPSKTDSRRACATRITLSNGISATFVVGV